jgi:hypothetical protein
MQIMRIPRLDAASVKVMRSHDYCHFEVALSADLTGLNSDEMTPAVDEMRKIAARLADKAVEQYKVAKLVMQRRLDAKRSISYVVEEAKAIEAMPETERSPEQQDTLKAWKDQVFECNRQYDYEDDWQEDEL